MDKTFPNKPNFRVGMSRFSTDRVSGFTLIEVMVGVAIFAVLAAMIVGSIQSNGDRNAKLEAQRFIAVMNEVRDEAVISGKTIVMQMSEKARNYSFSVYGANEEQAGEDTLLRTRTLHKSVKLKWEVFEAFNEDEEQEEESEDGELEQSELAQGARVFITALGELTPFQARFGGDDNDFIVELNNDGVLGMDIKPSHSF